VRANVELGAPQVWAPSGSAVGGEPYNAVVVLGVAEAVLAGASGTPPLRRLRGRVWNRTSGAASAVTPDTTGRDWWSAHAHANIWKWKPYNART
jgi:hypothetical protein